MKTIQRVILQVPMKRDLKKAAETVAEESGFSSLQDAIRMFLAKFAKRQLVVSIEEKEERLSPKAERRYTKIIEDIKRGKYVTKTKSLDELFAHLRS